MSAVNLPKFKKWAAQNKPLAEAVLMAKAFAQLERERVNAYVLPIFAEYEFYTDLEAKRDCKLERIADPRNLYLSENEKLVADYYAACDHAHREHGFTGPAGHCPALTAENLLMQAERFLLDAGCKLFGIDEAYVYGKDRDQMLKLLLGACLGACQKAAA